MDVEDTLASQIDYYRRRAAEYDATAVDDVEAASREFGAWVDRLDPSGDVLEIACGTGLCTQHLVGRARRLTAIDSSPEMIELARSRVGDRDTEFVVADVFAWEPEGRYDSILFSFWLSHVPPQRFADFWHLLERWLAPNGRVLFVDEGAPRAWQEHPDRCSEPEPPSPPSVEASEAPGGEPTRTSEAIVSRRLGDGTTHQVVKVFHAPEELTRSLAELGWSADVELADEGYIIGAARRADRP